MNNKNYLFYDLETTGLDFSFDQVVQFAAILTDQNLNELKRYNFLIRLNPDTIPSPYASITHQIPISHANEKGLSEYEAIIKIHQLINQPNTISLGYNTLGFDDEFLRFSFYRNLLDPYQHQYKDGCMRMDIYPMTIMTYLHDTERLNWPKNDQGHISFKLENLNEANKFVTEGRAHDALTDVEVTVQLARKLKENHKMWQYLENLFDKQNDQRQLEKLTDAVSIDGIAYSQGLLTNGKFGARNQYQSLAILLGTHQHYKNQSIWLRLDLDDLEQSIDQYLNKPNQDSDKETIIQDQFKEQLALPFVTKKFGETPFLLPLLERFTQKLPDKKLDNMHHNIQWLNENSNIFKQLKDIALSYKYPTYEHIDSQSLLYVNGFLKPFEKQKCDSFHQRDLKGKANLINQFSGALKDRALRIIGRLNPNLLSQEQLTLFQEYLESVSEYERSKRPLNYRGSHARGLDEVYNEIQNLKENDLSKNELMLLDELSEYLNI